MTTPFDSIHRLDDQAYRLEECPVFTRIRYMPVALVLDLIPGHLHTRVISRSALDLFGC